MSSRGSEVGGTGWSMFAGVFLAIAGLFNAIDGIVAIINAAYFDAGGLVFQTVQTWGWVFLIIGIVQALVGYMIIGRSTWARWTGLALAILSMAVAFLALGMYPWWAVFIIVIDGIVVWGLTARWEQ